MSAPVKLYAFGWILMADEPDNGTDTPPKWEWVRAGTIYESEEEASEWLNTCGVAVHAVPLVSGEEATAREAKLVAAGDAMASWLESSLSRNEGPVHDAVLAWKAARDGE